MLNFEWDNDKNKSNQAKHKISFEDATDVFNDEDRLQFELEKNGEWRNLTIGKAFHAITTVVYTMRNLIVRVISARRASQDERRAYLTNKFNKNGENE